MGVLIIDQDAINKIDKLIAYAEANEFSLESLLAIANDPAKAAGNFKEHNILLNNGYRVVFTIEQQPKFKAKHISISFNEDLPPTNNVINIIKLFGFKGNLDTPYVYMEDTEYGKAINIIEPIFG